MFGHKIGILASTPKSAADLWQLVKEATRRNATKEVADLNKTIAYLKLETDVAALDKPAKAKPTDVVPEEPAPPPHLRRRS